MSCRISIGRIFTLLLKQLLQGSEVALPAIMATINLYLIQMSTMSDIGLMPNVPAGMKFMH